MSIRKLIGSFLFFFIVGFIFIVAASIWPADAGAAFIDNGDGTVTDNNTSLTWLKDAGCGFLNATDTQWENALVKVNNLADSTDNSQQDCGLSDESVAGDWRLPNRRELWSIIDYANNQAPGAPFENVFNSQPYWTSTTVFSDDTKAWTVTMGGGFVNAIGLMLDETEKTTNGTLIWPVKGTTGGSAAVARTGQTETFEAGDDGDLQNGLAWPNPRFTINGTGGGNGTVTDNLTGNVWLRDANCTNFGQDTWNQTLSTASTLVSGQCGLSDGSQAGDWRIPSIRELESLVSAEATDPALPDSAGDGQGSEGNPFKNVQSSAYWSSTEIGSTGGGYVVNFLDGKVDEPAPLSNNFGWAVRDFVTCRGDSEPDRDVDGEDLADYAGDFTPPDPVDQNDPPLVVFARNFGKVVECAPNG